MTIAMPAGLSTETDYFHWFGLPATQDLDTALLAQRYRELQQVVHPDRHAAGTAAEHLLAVQWSARLNEAYQCLRDPLRRAQYLLQLQGVDASSEATFQGDRAFLLQQMDWRERLAELQQHADAVVLNDLFDECAQARDAIQADFRTAYEAERFEQAAACVARWQFLDKFHHALETVEDNLQD